MGFGDLQQLPSHNLNVPEYRPPQIPNPPVYDTSKTLHQLNALMEHFSPETRAKRKAAVAKANYEYRMYQPGGKAERDATWMYQMRVRQRRIQDLTIRQKEKALKGGYLDPDHAGAMEIFGPQPQEEVNQVEPDELNGAEDIE